MSCHVMEWNAMQQTFCCPVKAAMTLLRVVSSPGENSNTISSKEIAMSWPPSLEVGVEYSKVSEQGLKTCKKGLLTVFVHDLSLM